jgi:ABC-type glutathione transport system ATPase component
MTARHDIHIASGDRVLVSVKGFEIPENRITVLLGESGIGKSLASKALYGLLSSDDLTITIDGMPYEDYVHRQEIVALKANSFFVFQEPSSHLNPLMTLGAQLDEGSLSVALHHEEILDQLFETSADEDVRRLLEIYPKPYRPSGGEKQRMLLAMAFKKIDVLFAHVNTESRELFVFDEPTGSLDNHDSAHHARLLDDQPHCRESQRFDASRCVQRTLAAARRHCASGFSAEGLSVLARIAKPGNCLAGVGSLVDH